MERGLSIERGAFNRAFRPSSAIQRLAAAAGLSLALCLSALFGASSANAQCSHSGSTENCSGSLPNPVDFNTSSNINTLNVFDATNGTSFVRLQGSGAAPSAGSNAVFTCGPVASGPNMGDALCTITQNMDGSQSCTPQTNMNGAQGVCQPGTTTPGPSGNAGPAVTVNVNTPTSGPIQIGAGRPMVAVTGLSQGSQGGGGGNSYVAGSAGNGGPGDDGGNVVVTFSGVIPNGSYGGIIAASQGGNGGNGGSFYGIGGSAGSGGQGGFGESATAQFNAGSIETSGQAQNGIFAGSQGGHGGNAGNGGGLVFVPGGGNAAGQAGPAEVDTAVGTSIVTHGDYANGIQALSVGGGGGNDRAGSAFAIRAAEAAAPAATAARRPSTPTAPSPPLATMPRAFSPSRSAAATAGL